MHLERFIWKVAGTNLWGLSKALCRFRRSLGPKSLWAPGSEPCKAKLKWRNSELVSTPAHHWGAVYFRNTTFSWATLGSLNIHEIFSCWKWKILLRHKTLYYILFLECAFSSIYVVFITLEDHLQQWSRSSSAAQKLKNEIYRSLQKHCPSWNKRWVVIILWCGKLPSDLAVLTPKIKLWCFP